jgi:hypothetical protein
MKQSLTRLLENLTPEEQAELETFVAFLLARRELKGKEALVTRGTDGKPSRSILELKGLGKEIWEGIDAQTYLDQERRSWHG